MARHYKEKDQNSTVSVLVAFTDIPNKEHWPASSCFVQLMPQLHNLCAYNQGCCHGFLSER